MSIETTTCAECGIVFGAPERYFGARREDKKSFFCPNGHSLSYRQSDLDKVRGERDRALQQVARAEEEAATARRLLEQEKLSMKRLKKRTAAGTCPCCQRTFSNMSNHMRNKHPGFVAEQTSNVVPMVPAKRGKAK